MLSGETLIDDGVLQRGMKPLAKMFALREVNWPVMGWDYQGDYWIKNGLAEKIVRSDPVQMYLVETFESQRGAGDFAKFECDERHQLLCKDGSFHSLREVIDSYLRIQHVRGNGHSVNLKSVQPSKVDHGYGLIVRDAGCFIHSSVIHRDES